MKTKKFIDFIITQKCTYKCQYCSQSKSEQKEYLNANKETIENFIKFLDKLEKDFEITITGGEAILHPDFFYITEKIKNKGFKINLITNLSFEYEIYKRIFKSLGKNLKNFDISIHLDEIKDFNSAKEKLEKVILNKPKNTKININIPIYELDDKKENKISQIIKIAQKYKAKYNFQHIRTLNKFMNYNEDEKKYFKNEKFKKSYANLCHAGKYSAIIYENGNVYRCYSSRFDGANFLGNINDKDFKLNTTLKPCIHKYCTCPKPEKYNQITDKKDFITAGYTKFKNYIYLPYLILKNRKIIKMKLYHYFKNFFIKKT